MLDVFLFAFVGLGAGRLHLCARTSVPAAGDRRRARLRRRLRPRRRLQAFRLLRAARADRAARRAGRCALSAAAAGSPARPAPRMCSTSSVGYFAFFFAPALAYLACFIPGAIHAGSILYLFTAQQRDAAHHARPFADPPLHEHWATWPIEWRPVWYLFDVAGGSDKWDDDNPAQAVCAIANPLAADRRRRRRSCGRCGARSIKVDLASRDRRGRLLRPVGCPGSSNPKGLEFFYYFFPSILCLGPALALGVLPRAATSGARSRGSVLLVADATMFLFFLPMLEASLTVTPDELDARTWLASWR